MGGGPARKVILLAGPPPLDFHAPTRRYIPICLLISCDLSSLPNRNSACLPVAMHRPFDSIFTWPDPALLPMETPHARPFGCSTSPWDRAATAAIRHPLTDHARKCTSHVLHIKIFSQIFQWLDLNKRIMIAVHRPEPPGDQDSGRSWFYPHLEVAIEGFQGKSRLIKLSSRRIVRSLLHSPATQLFLQDKAVFSAWWWQSL